MKVLAPVRVQISRRKGTRLPPNTIRVDRWTPWGNPWRAQYDSATERWIVLDPDSGYRDFPTRSKAAAYAVRRFQRSLQADPELQLAIQVELRGRHLACWCALDMPCHADILLEVANLREVEQFGGKLLRIDIPCADGEQVTEYYGATAIYALRPCSEAVMRAGVDRWSDPRPVRPVDYRPAAALPSAQAQANPEPEGEADEDEQF